MAEYIKRESAIAIIEEKQKELCPVGRYGRGYVYGSDREKYDAWDEIINDLENMPTAEAVSLHDIYRVIAGHSYYHGDRILAALTCIAEEKEVNPVSPADVAPVVHARWIPFHSETAGDIQYCSNCEIGNAAKSDFCPNCGAKMDGGDGNALN